MRHEVVLSRIVAVAPGFAPRWESFKRRWEEEPLPLYLAMGELADYLVGSFSSGSTEELPAVFALLEQHLESDDLELHNLIVVGLFEVLQNLGSQEPFDLAVFEQWLGPIGTRKWHEIDDDMNEVPRWEAEHTARQPSTAEIQEELESVSSPELRRLLARDLRFR